MAELIYSAIASLDGYIEDSGGNFDWAEPDEQVHRFINDLEREAGTHLYGRRMYQIMIPWETDPSLAAHSECLRDFANIWQSADKIVYSTTLAAVSTSRTRLERSFDPQAIRRLKESSVRDILIGGHNLAAQVFEAGLVDQCHLFLAPVIVGDGKPCFSAGLRLDLELEDLRRFESGMLFLRYRVKT
jgi:dihydrofolate reductase